MSTSNHDYPEFSPQSVQGSRFTTRYLALNHGLYLVKDLKDGPDPTRLTNFAAKITRDLKIDDGARIRREFELTTLLNGRKDVFTVAASEFKEVHKWVPETIGPEAVIFPGDLASDHVRVAIQLFSGTIPRSSVYGHTGWRELNGISCYLDASGVIRPDPDRLHKHRAKDRDDRNEASREGLEGHGPINPINPIQDITQPEVRVRLPDDLADHALPAHDPNADIPFMIRSMLHFLDLLPPRLSYPLFAAPWTAALGLTDFGIHLVGGTGQKKTSVVALLQQCFSPKAHRKNRNC